MGLIRSTGERWKSRDAHHPYQIQFSAVHIHTYTYTYKRRIHTKQCVTHALRVRYASRPRLCVQVEEGAG